MFNYSGIPLSDLVPGQEAQVQAISGPGREVRLRLAALGIRPSAKIRILGHGPGRGPILVEVDGTRLALGRGLARRILVALQKEHDSKTA